MPTEPAIRCADREIGYPELRERAMRLAGGLAAAGVRRGDRVALVMRNSVEFMEVFAGLIHYGAHPVPVNWHLTADELRYILADCEAAMVFTQTEFADRVAEAVPDRPLIEAVPTRQLAAAYGIPHTEPSGHGTEYERWLAAQDPIEEAADPNDATTIFYTSGTTGRPKGVVRGPVTPEQREASVAALKRWWGLEPGTRTLIPAPMYHAAPNAVVTASLVLETDLTIAPRFEPTAFLELLQRHAVQQVQVVPTMFVRLLQLPEQVRRTYDLSALRHVVHAAAPCPVEVKRAIIDWLGPIVYEYYGSTETGALIWCTSQEWLAHPGTVGRPVEGARVRILGPDGRDQPVGQTGVIYLKRQFHFPDFTYLGRPEKRAEIDQEGFVTMGDMGYLDADGFLYVTDRSTDMIISGGVNIYPAEIEGTLITMPGVRDVAVFGIPDPTYGESVAAHIDADESVTEDAVRAFARERLAGYKVPQHIVFDANLPREESGKLFKRRIRDRYWQDAASNI